MAENPRFRLIMDDFVIVTDTRERLLQYVESRFLTAGYEQVSVNRWSCGESIVRLEYVRD